MLEREGEYLHFLTLVFYTMNEMDDFIKVQKDLLQIILDSHKGAISTRLITPDQLLTELASIKQNIARDLDIPYFNNGQNLLNFYHLMTCKARITEQFLIFELKTPIIEIEYYDVYQPIPVPTYHLNESFYIKPAMELIAINQKRGEFYELTKNEFQQCAAINETFKICRPMKHANLIRANENICEINMLHYMNKKHCKYVKYTNGNRIVTLKHNKYLFSYDESELIALSCAHTQFTNDTI